VNLPNAKAKHRAPGGGDPGGAPAPSFDRSKSPTTASPAKARSGLPTSLALLRSFLCTVHGIDDRGLTFQLTMSHVSVPLPLPGARQCAVVSQSGRGALRSRDRLSGPTSPWVRLRRRLHRQLSATLPWPPRAASPNREYPVQWPRPIPWLRRTHCRARPPYTGPPCRRCSPG